MSIVEGGDWVDITTLLEKTAGDAYSIQNISTGELLLKEAASKPDITDNNGPVLFTPKYKSNSIFNVNNDRGKIWGKLVDITRPAILAAGEFVKDKRWVYSFDGIDDRGALATRAINPDGDNTFEFWTPTNFTLNSAIISQNVTTAGNLREFQFGVDIGGAMYVGFGGTYTTVFTAAQGLKPATKYGVTLVGTQFSAYEGGLGGTLVRQVSFVKGAAREPSAVTLIGCRGNGAGSYAQFFNGLQYDIKINGTLWPMADRNQPIQLPSPSGLGAELITQEVMESPFERGTHWTYLGDGRWQYIGNGSFNAITFITTANQPETGFLEFEVESITGPMRCYTTIASVGTLQSSPVFSTVGRFRYYYTSKSGLGGNGNFFSFFRSGTDTVVSCVIKNISFKPLGSCNPLTLVNSNPDRWQEIDL